MRCTFIESTNFSAQILFLYAFAKHLGVCVCVLVKKQIIANKSIYWIQRSRQSTFIEFYSLSYILATPMLTKNITFSQILSHFARCSTLTFSLLRALIYLRKLFMFTAEVGALQNYSLCSFSMLNSLSQSSIANSLETNGTKENNDA